MKQQMIISLSLIAMFAALSTPVLSDESGSSGTGDTATIAVRAVDARTGNPVPDAFTVVLLMKEGLQEGATLPLLPAQAEATSAAGGIATARAQESPAAVSGGGEAQRPQEPQEDIESIIAQHRQSKESLRPGVEIEVGETEEVERDFGTVHVTLKEIDTVTRSLTSAFLSVVTFDKQGNVIDSAEPCGLLAVEDSGIYCRFVQIEVFEIDVEEQKALVGVGYTLLPDAYNPPEPPESREAFGPPIMGPEILPAFKGIMVGKIEADGDDQIDLRPGVYAFLTFGMGYFPHTQRLEVLGGVTYELLATLSTEMERPPIAIPVVREVEGRQIIESREQVQGIQVREPITAIAPQPKQVSITPVGERQFEIESMEVKAKTEVSLSIEQDRLVASTQTAREEIILPDTVVETAASAQLREEEVRSVELLESQAGKLVYKIKALEKRKLLGLIPTEVEASLEVDANSGEIGKVERPFYAVLTTR